MNWRSNTVAIPTKKPARIYMDNGTALPIEVLGGRPGYINFLDALNGWQLSAPSSKPPPACRQRPRSNMYLLPAQLWANR